MFTGILGNEELKQILKRLRSGGRMPNAMLFAGPDGVGKRLFALDVARSFVCTTHENDACGVCQACVRAGQFEFPKPDGKDAYKNVILSHHPDVGLVTTVKKQIAVDAIRDLEREAHFHPYEGSGRTFIIDDADKMNEASSNALLKTLEEPDPTSHLILVTSRPDTLLSTIRSRCQVFRFAPVLTGLIEKHLLETGVADAESAQLAARLSEGSVGRAISIDIARVRGRRRELVRTLDAAFVRGDFAAALHTGEVLNEPKNKDNFEDDLEMLLTLIRDIWTITLGGEPAVHTDIRPELEHIARAAGPKHLSAIIEQIGLTQERFFVNINRKLAADALFTAMAA
ncbi:MAG: DNA polymerase III subunit delta' [Acidobacteria bacterium]|nr:DNA polymerase III subunit delta' [Acidobacteriota bacterium]